MALRASLRRCFTSISVRIVSGCRRERLREIVSLPPEKIRSTATADPWKSNQLNIFVYTSILTNLVHQIDLLHILTSQETAQHGLPTTSTDRTSRSLLVEV